MAKKAESSSSDSGIEINTAVDAGWAQIADNLPETVTINGKSLTSDLYSTQVLPGDPITFTDVSPTKDGTLKIMIEISGKNPSAKASYMVGIDRIELR